MKKVIVVSMFMMLWSGQAFATCLASINPDTPTADFVDHGNGTVTHTKTGLMWKQCPEGLSGAGCATGTAATYTWQGALQAAESLNAAGGFAGFTDWRVPNIKELHSIVEHQCDLSSVNATIFPATGIHNYWSASPSFSITSRAAAIIFDSGFVNHHSKSFAFRVRFVRGGQ